MIGIIGAMDLEIYPLAEMMTEKKTEKITGMEYFYGKLFGKDAVLCICGEGKVLAAVSAQNMITRFHPDMILNIGVAGTMTDRLHVFDIAVADKVVQHDYNITQLGYPMGYHSYLERTYIDCDEKIVAAVRECLDKLSVHYEVGTIASGDLFVATEKQKRSVINNFSAIACEMEGAAVGMVCYVNSVPFGVIRAISDEADGASDVDYPTFKVASGKRSVEIVSEIIKHL